MSLLRSEWSGGNRLYKQVKKEIPEYLQHRVRDAVRRKRIVSYTENPALIIDDYVFVTRREIYRKRISRVRRNFVRKVDQSDRKWMSEETPLNPSTRPRPPTPYDCARPSYIVARPVTISLGFRYKKNKRENATAIIRDRFRSFRNQDNVRKKKNGKRFRRQIYARRRSRRFQRAKIKFEN